MTDTKHTELVEKARHIVLSSGLTPKDKRLLEGRLPYAAESMLEIFVRVCEEDPFSVETIVKGLKKKLDAQGNLKKLHEIVKQERREVEELALSS